MTSGLRYSGLGGHCEVRVSMRAVGVMRDGRALAAAGSLGLLSISCGQRGEVSRKVSVAPTAAAVAKPSLYTSAVEARRWIDLALARNLHESLVKRIDQECSGRSFQLGHFSKPFEAHEATKAVRVAFDLIRGLSGAIEKTTDNTFTSVNTTGGWSWPALEGPRRRGRAGAVFSGAVGTRAARAC